MSMEIDLPYLARDKSRHGQWRLYVRKNGRKIRILEAPGSAAFTRAYGEAIEALDGPALEAGPRRAPSGTLGWLAACYFGSSEFKGLDPRSQGTRRRILDECLLEPRKPGSSDLMWACPVNRLTATHMQMLRDRKIDKPGAANNRLKYLSSMFGWAVEKRMLSSNPARDAKPIKYATGGFYTWTDADVLKFEERHPIRSRARLALALLLYTGVRRDDVVRLGRQHVKGSSLVFVPRKTRHLRAEASVKPILPDLARILEASPTGDLTFLVTAHGRPFTTNGFGNRFRDWCDQAGLPQCTAHGLRKAGATRAANLGATDRQLMALFDWTSSSQATTYTKKADKTKLAGEAMKLLGRDQTPNEECPTLTVPPKIRTA